MMQAHVPERLVAARDVMTSVADSPATADLMGSLFDFILAIKRSPADGSGSMPILMRLGGGRPVRSRDLAEELHLDQSTVSRHLATLEHDGLVQRTPDENDRRSHLLTPTEAGTAATRQWLTGRVRQFETATSDWPTDDVATFARLLDDFTQGLRAQERTTA